MITAIVTAVASAMCRMSERGYPPCYSCRDAAARLWLSSKGE